MHLHAKAFTLLLSNLPFSLDYLPSSAYLVGGAVRDTLLQHPRDYLDLDFVLPADAIKIARLVAKCYQAGFVVLDAKRQIARVVFAQGTADFAQQEGDSIATDLQRRDFTINAIAYHLKRNEIIDPLQGVKDLQQGLVRMICTANLEDDPLRLLRAYRQAAQLNFHLESTTQATIRRLAPLLEQISAERVQAELNYLLSSSAGSRWLTKVWEDGLFTVWLPHATAKNLQQIAYIDQFIALLTQIWPDLESKSQASPSNGSLSWLGLAKLASLVSTKSEIAEAQLLRLKYSRAEIRTVSVAVKYLPRLLCVATNPLSLREQYFLFLDVGKAFLTLLLLTVGAMVNSTIFSIEESLELLEPLVKHYVDPHDQVAHPTPLITGNDLMRSLNIKPSPQIGNLLTEVQVARIEGKISTSQDALEFAASLLRQ